MDNQITTTFHLEEELKKEFKVDSSGRTFTTIRGAARLMKVNDGLLSRHFGADLNTSKLSQMLMDAGFAPLTFAVEGIPDVALTIIARYFWRESKQCSDETKEVAELFILATSAIGVRKVIQSELGYVEEDRITRMENMLLAHMAKYDHLLEASETKIKQLEAEKDDIEEELEVYTETTGLVTYHDAVVETTNWDVFRKPLSASEYNYFTGGRIPVEQVCQLQRLTGRVFFIVYNGVKPKRSQKGYVYKHKEIACIEAAIQYLETVAKYLSE